MVAPGQFGLHHSKQHRETLSKGPRHFSYEPFSLFFYEEDC